VRKSFRSGKASPILLFTSTTGLEKCIMQNRS
jgi:hypothetical protein